MAFKARKTRQAKRTDLIEGTQLIASAAIRDEYTRAIKDMIRALCGDYRAELEVMLQTPQAKRQFAMDGAGKLFNRFFQRMWLKWEDYFTAHAGENVNKFALKVDRHSFSTVGKSLKALGIQQPKDISSETFENQIQAHVEYNVSLIKSIGKDLHDTIERATWNSLTSPEGSESGGFGIYNAIQEVMGKEFSRAELIATDQNSKMYSVLNDARMRQNGVVKFKWMHSGAGKVPRECHKDWDGDIFLNQGGPNELYRADGTQVVPGGNIGKADVGKPGYPIRCKCRAIPVIEF